MNRHVLTPDSHPDLGIWDADPKPERIYLEGSPEAVELLKRLPARGLAIVGTRDPQPRSELLLKKWIAELRYQDLIIISGFARGIDSVAHEAALDAGIPTIAIVGGGLDIPYPRQNQELRKRIIRQHGLIASEYPDGTEPMASHFLDRNRLIAAWSQGVLVIEAGARSGALNTAKWARSQHRSTFAVPNFPDDPAFLGNQTLIDDGHAHPMWGVHSLGACWLELATLGLPKQPKKGQRQKRQFNMPHQCQMDFEADSNRVPGTPPDVIRIVRSVQFFTSQQGGANIQELLDQVIKAGWTAERFFQALEISLEMKLIFDKNGLLLKNPQLSY